MMLKICLVLLSVLNVWCETDYCELDKCPEARSHTMCFFPTSDPGSKCNNHERLMDGKIRQELLDTHNKNRNEIAKGSLAVSLFKPVKNMNQLYWDEELEKIAQRLVDQCIYGHDTCRDVERFKVGQNIGLQENTDGHQPSQNIFVQTWFDEVNGWVDKDVKETIRQALNESTKTDFGKAVGPSAALMTVDTSLVGCGESSYYMGNNRHTFFLACNYGPASGDASKSPSNNMGEACSDCPEGTKCGLDPKFPKLCANTNPPSVPTGGPITSSGTGFVTSRLLQALTSVLVVLQSKC